MKRWNKKAVDKGREGSLYPVVFLRPPVHPLMIG